MGKLRAATHVYAASLPPGDLQWPPDIRVIDTGVAAKWFLPAAFVALAVELKTRLITAGRRLTRLMASSPFAAHLEWVGQWA